MDGPEVARIRQAYENYRRHGKWNSPNPGREYMVFERHQNLHSILSRRREYLLRECKILDIGCGNGSLLGWFYDQGARAENLIGIDLMPDRIEAARRRYPDFTFEEANAESIGLADGSFDLISVFTVFSSILDDRTSINIARTIARLLRRNGAVIWYDLRYPSPNNNNVRAMTRQRIRNLFPGFDLDLESTTLLPPVAERLGSHTEWLYPLMRTLPVLRSHYIGMLTSKQ